MTSQTGRADTFGDQVVHDAKVLADISVIRSKKSSSFEQVSNVVRVEFASRLCGLERLASVSLMFPHSRSQKNRSSTVQRFPFRLAVATWWAGRRSPTRIPTRTGDPL